MTLAEQGNIKAAIADFNQTVKIDPTFVDGYYNLGLLNYRQGNHKQAVAQLNQALNINPKLADAYGNRGQLSTRNSFSFYYRVRQFSLS